MHLNQMFPFLYIKKILNVNNIIKQYTFKRSHPVQYSYKEATPLIVIYKYDDYNDRWKMALNKSGSITSLFLDTLAIYIRI